MIHRILLVCTLLPILSAYSADDRPNILFFFADDWGRYASVYSDADTPSLNDVIATSNIDRIGNEGVIFRNDLMEVNLYGIGNSSETTIV